MLSNVESNYALVLDILFLVRTSRYPSGTLVPFLFGGLFIKAEY